MPAFRFCLLAALAGLWLACGERPTPSAAPPSAAGAAAVSEETAAAETIEWYAGSVEDAFALAERENRPIFLYWGAVWCPPCHYLRTKVFTLPEVAERLSRTVAVYLDGDTERAQELGERYRTAGYPTVIVFTPDAREVLRIDSLLPADAWVEALDRALGASRSAREVFGIVAESGVGAVTPDELRLLADASWNQDPALDLPAVERVPVLRALATKTPPELPGPRARFLGLWLRALTETGAELPPPAEAVRREARDRLLQILGDPVRRRENLLLLVYAALPTVDLLAPDAGPEREELLDAWETAARELGEDSEVTTDDRLSSLLPRLRLARARDADGRLPEALRREVVERTERAVREVDDRGERQAVLGTVAGLLKEIGRPEDAARILREEGERSTAPWYWISWRASIEADAGRPEAAVELWRRAWKASEGSYSRFRWGVTYLERRIEHLPDQVEPVRDDLAVLLDDLLEAPDPFSGGYWSRLQRLDGALRSWVEGAPEVLALLRERLAPECEQLADDVEDGPRSRCVSLLRPAQAG